MNREALFCDGTGDYVCPAEPEINEKVVLRFRTAHNDVEHPTLSYPETLALESIHLAYAGELVFRFCASATRLAADSAIDQAGG